MRSTPAFPLGFIDTRNGTLPDGDEVVRHEGMTLRDYFAASVLQGLVASNEVERWPAAAAQAYVAADEMLKAREP